MNYTDDNINPLQNELKWIENHVFSKRCIQIWVCCFGSTKLNEAILTGWAGLRLKLNRYTQFKYINSLIWSSCQLECVSNTSNHQCYWALTVLYVERFIAKQKGAYLM